MELREDEFGNLVDEAGTIQFADWVSADEPSRAQFLNGLDHAGVPFTYQGAVAPGVPGPMAPAAPAAPSGLFSAPPPVDPSQALQQANTLSGYQEEPTQQPGSLSELGYLLSSFGAAMGGSGEWTKVAGMKMVADREERAQQRKQRGAARDAIFSQLMKGAGAGQKLPTSVQEFLFAQENPAFASFLESKRGSGGGGTHITNVMPGTAPTKSTVNLMQKEDWARLQQLTSLEKIRDIWKPEYSTYYGRFKNWIGAEADKLNAAPKEVRDYVARYKDWSSRVEQMFSAYRRMITGAAASVVELSDLRKQYLNTSLSPAQFEAQMNLLKEQFTSMYHMSQRVQKEGFFNLSKEQKEHAWQMALTGTIGPGGGTVEEVDDGPNPLADFSAPEPEPSGEMVTEGGFGPSQPPAATQQAGNLSAAQQRYLEIRRGGGSEEEARAGAMEVQP